MTRLFEIRDPVLLALIMEPYKDWTHGFDPWTWFDYDKNYALWDGETSVALMQEDAPDNYYVHTFYDLRGREALDFSKACVSYAFTNLGAKLLKGLTPENKRHARLAARLAGFKSYGVIDTPVEPCEMFVLTKPEWSINE